MGTKNNPAKWDCYANAAPDEPMFVLLARDASAPGLVRRWATLRQDAINNGTKPPEDRAQVNEAFQLADEMTRWRNARLAALSAAASSTSSDS
jgi:hypothetical protein